MISKSNFESKIKKDLIQKASEAKLPDDMISRIIDQIENDRGGKYNMLRDRITNGLFRRVIIVSLCGILAFTGVLFTFSEKTRSFALDVVSTIRTIFVLEKIEGEYKIVEKLSTDPIFVPLNSITSHLSDEKISEKLGFDVYFPAMLYRDYEYRYKSEGVGIAKEISKEMGDQLEADIFEAINDEAAYNGLSQYEPYRIVSASYRNTEGYWIFISMRAVEVLPSNEGNSSIITEVQASDENNSSVKTKVGNIDAVWTMVMIPNYGHIVENGVGKSDLYTKPESIINGYSLRWEADGVRYSLNNRLGQELSMDEMVKIAESFMEQVNKRHGGK